MEINTNELKRLIQNSQEEIKKLQQDLEIFLLLDYQLSLDKVSEDSIQFPDHLADDALQRAIPKVCKDPITQILELPILSQKLVVF